MTPLSAIRSEITESVWFASGELALEGRLSYPESGEVRGAAVMAGPHPLLGGDMDNNVVRGLCSGLAQRGVAVLSFNYRGIGASAGVPPDVTASLAEFWTTARTEEEEHYANDFRAALGALALQVGTEVPRALVGYSFGCSLLTAGVDDPECPLVLVAPTIGQHTYAAPERVPNPVLVVASDEDFAHDADSVTEWFTRLGGPKRLVRGDWDSHFFRGLEEQLAETVFAFLRQRWEGEP
jgi:alpha/beta superfamily hydrolase